MEELSCLKDQFVKFVPFLVWICDFDGTITKEDTTNLLVKHSISLSTLSEIEKESLTKEWDKHVENYFNAYSKIYSLAKHNLTKEVHSALDSFEKLYSFQKNFRNLNYWSVKVTSEKGFLRGISKSNLSLLGNMIELQENVLEILHKIKERSKGLSILSINWCEDLIISAISKSPPLNVPIFSNKLIFHQQNSEVISNGLIEGDIHDGIDKWNLLNQVIKKSFSPNGFDSHLFVYVGDSFYDLLCCLDCDIGMLLHPSDSTLELCNLTQIQVIPLEDEMVALNSLLESISNKKKQTSLLKHGVIYSAKNWTSISNFFGFEKK